MKRCIKTEIRRSYYYYYYYLFVYFLTPVLNSRGMKKITLCNTKKYKNPAGMNQLLLLLFTSVSCTEFVRGRGRRRPVRAFAADVRQEGGAVDDAARHEVTVPLPARLDQIHGGRRTRARRQQPARPAHLLPPLQLLHTRRLQTPPPTALHHQYVRRPAA